MTASVVLRRYVEPPPEQRSGMPRGSYHARVCHPQWKGEAHVVGGVRYDVTVCCPDCGNQLTLSAKVHAIAASGAISPSLVCPLSDCGDGRVRCSWHVFARLEDWPPR